MRDSESTLTRRLLIAASVLGARLFRNQVGTYRLARPDCKRCQTTGRVVSSGLAVGSPDLVGWQSVTITPSMVGQTLAVFVGVEVKRADGRLSEPQRTWQAVLARAGARVGVARSVADLDVILDRATTSCGGRER